MRRSAISIPSNIAEGCARCSDKETMQFINISIGSAAELQTQLIIANNLGYLNNFDIIMDELENIKKMLYGMYKYLENKN